VEYFTDRLISTLRRLLSNTFLPNLEAAIGVGSAFEGWSPREEDMTFRVFVPMTPPRGHVFHLELDTEKTIPGRNFRIHVEQVCTCRREQYPGEMLCFLHRPEEELRNKQGRSILDLLCTGSYLDVHKTAHWFNLLVKEAWVSFPESHTCKLKMLPFSRSCKFQMKRGSGKCILIEMMFGVRQDNSDIFVSSQSTEAVFTPDTMWPESYAVAEAKFFRLMARDIPHNSFHLKCLHVFAQMVVGSDFSSCTFKTVVMHLLTTTPLSGWTRRDFPLRLLEIMRYLRHRLKEKRLNHFFLGNEGVPEEIVLPSDIREAEPLNLFQHHAEARHEFEELQDR
ncbi:Inositol 1,4,5-trisphosphate receptor-interacting protein-like 1, partial [Mesitornis unicolor]